MNRLSLRALAIASVVAIAACSGHSPGGVVPSTIGGLGPENGFYRLTRPNAVYPACPPRRLRPGEVRCFAWVRTDMTPTVLPDGSVRDAGYTPAEIESAYNLDASKGAGQTVVIVDMFGYKTALRDVLAYRASAHLPATSIKILTEYGTAGPLPAQPPSSDPNEFGWVIEQSLDLDAVSAACPRCKIVLLEVSPYDSNGINIALDTALRMARIVSMSFGSPESGSANVGFPSSGYALVAAAGDYGGGEKLQSGTIGGPQMPCAYAAIICAGGTHLVKSPSGWHSTVWNDDALPVNTCFGGPCGATGSGCSRIVPKPSWQHDAGCRMRSEVDISADASVTTPLAVYNTQAGCRSNWCSVGGTSLSAPLIAGMFALAGNASTRHGAMEIWRHHRFITDVTHGTNVYDPVTGPCASGVTYICIAGPGYDGPTGWGSPNGTPDL